LFSIYFNSKIKYLFNEPLGSEAAAATAVIMNRCMAVRIQSPPVEFKADRPFLFYIREAQQNIVLFQGRFVSPPTAA
jgi:serpin B